jgi:hypothetical protein
MPPFPAGITTERGAPGQVAFAGIPETWEATPELRWPASVAVYDQMRRSDAQVVSVLRAVTLPVRRTTWRVAGDDTDPRVLGFVEAELGLAPEGEGRRRRRREGISFDRLLAEALLSLPFGHMVFEQVYAVGPPAADAPAGLPPRLAHLRKLGPRMPRTLAGFDLARDGGLDAVRQWVTHPDGRVEEVRLPNDRLVVFVNEREGADWTGTSILRGAYKHWLIKDSLLRVGAMAVERNGMGVPVVYYGPEGNADDALGYAKAFRAGEEAGAAAPDGTYRIELLGVTGQTRDELPLVKYHDESIGRSALAMFLNLGHDRGARSLGETFVDYFVMALGAVIDEIAETVTEHVIRDLVELNFGGDEPYPELVADELTPESLPTAEALKALVEAQVLTPDPELERYIRRRSGLPDLDEEELPPGEPPGPGGLPGPESIVGVIEEDEPDAGEAGDTRPPRRPRAVKVPAHTRKAPTFAGVTTEELEQRLATLSERLAGRRR